MSNPVQTTLASLEFSIAQALGQIEVLESELGADAVVMINIADDDEHLPETEVDIIPSITLRKYRRVAAKFGI